MLLRAVGKVYGARLGGHLAGMPTDQSKAVGLGLLPQAGLAIGLAYVVPIAVCVKWFPDKKGMITGLAVAGFGFGATIWVKMAQGMDPEEARAAVRAMRYPPDGIRGSHPTS